MKRCYWITRIFAAALILALSSGARQSLAGEAAPFAGSTAPSMWVTPLVLDFGPVGVGETSGTLIVNITNNGNDTLTNFAGGGVYPPFGASQNCAAGVAPGGSCQYFFDFSPSEAGTFTTTSNSSTNAGPFTIDLMGRGRSVIFGSGQRVTPRSLDFGPVGVSLSGPTLVVTITNQSPFTSITDWAGGGVNAPVGASQNCAGGVAPGESCQFYYTFDPTETGMFSTTSDVSNSFGSFTIELRGEGAGAGLSVSPLVLDFGSVSPGGSGVVQVVTIKNTGLATLTNFAGGGVNSPFSATQNCAAGVPPGDTCQFNYNFSPTEWGRFSAISSVSTNAGSFSIQLTGGAELPSIALSFPQSNRPAGRPPPIHPPQPERELHPV
jgi:hypothetical protein